MADPIHRKALISGKVQGVWYRASTQQQAQAMGLTGWVRNLPTGEVELAVEGPAAAVENLLVWCQSGPPQARVDSVQVAEGEVEGFTVFEVRR